MLNFFSKSITRKSIIIQGTIKGLYVVMLEILSIYECVGAVYRVYGT